MAADLRGGARPGSGRKPKPAIEQSATKGIASEILAMDGPPDHERACKCRVCVEHRKRKCECLKVEGQPAPESCTKFAAHRICHCEVCRWWTHRLSKDERIRYDADCYLTNRRDGRPAQGVFSGDTREIKPDLDFGDLLMPAAPDQPRKTGKPN